mgnify:CR=1 FL=1
MRLHLFNQSFNPFTGVAESGVTSSAFYLGDASMAHFSLTTSSATASRWTLQGYLGASTEGFQTALPALIDWFTVKAVTAQGFYSVDSISNWARFQRTPSASSTTVMISIAVRP